MKTNKPNDNGPLGDLLHEWKVREPLPPRFEEQVWRRLQRVETVPAPSDSMVIVIKNWIATMLPRPALATLYVVVLLVIGAGAGWNQARLESAQITSNLRTRYVQAVDPYQATP